MRRFFFTEIPKTIDSFFSIPENQINHLIRVLRMKVDDCLEISDGSGMIVLGIIVHVTNDEVIIRVIDIKEGKEKAIHCIAFLAELKSDAMDNAISILAEHGIPRIIPFFASRSIPNFDNKQAQKKQERRQKIVDETVKKVGGLYQSYIETSINFNQLPSFLESISQKIVFYEAENSSSQKLSTIDFNQESAFFIGPEGGFTEKEIQQLTKWGCNHYSLGTRILRAPQATSAAATLIRYFTENH